MRRLKLRDVQEFYPFKQSLLIYTMGLSGHPEEQEQKAFIASLMAEFPKELGYDDTLDIYSRLIIDRTWVIVLYPVYPYHGFVVLRTSCPTSRQQKTLHRLNQSRFLAITGEFFADMLAAWIAYCDDGEQPWSKKR